MAGEDKEYTDWVKSRPCYQCGKIGCDPHHRTGAGMALRSHDYKSIPLCRWCHTAFHAASGPFKWMDKEGRAEWQDKAIELTVRARRMALGGSLAEPDITESKRPSRHGRSTTSR